MWVCDMWYVDMLVCDMYGVCKMWYVMCSYVGM